MAKLRKKILKLDCFLAKASASWHIKRAYVTIIFTHLVLKWSKTKICDVNL